MVNVDPVGKKGDFSITNFVKKGEDVLSGDVVCNICGTKMGVDDIWKHFKKIHYDDAYQREKQLHKGCSVNFLEKDIVAVEHDGVGEIFILPTYTHVSFDNNVVEVKFDKAVCGVNEKNIGSSIQKRLEKSDELPDVIDVWRSTTTGKLGFKFGYEQ